jgi:hypothetical protein
MALSATNSSAPSPAIEGCYKSYASNSTCPSNGTHTIPICNSSIDIGNSCFGEQVHGCLAAESTRCFTSGLDFNIATSYAFIIANVGNVSGTTTVAKLLACYQPPLANVTCPAAPQQMTSLTAFWSANFGSAAGGCVNLDDAGKCTAWWVQYNADIDKNGTCTKN